MRKKYLILFSIMGMTIAIDQLTKQIVFNRLELGEIISIIPGFFNVSHVRNTGAAFGLLAGSPEWFRIPFFIFLPIIALIFLIIIFRKIEENKKLVTFSLACIAGGAIGNFIDRIRFHYVVDFIDFYVGKIHWPSFNIADIAIVIGVAIFAYHAAFLEKKAK